MGHYVEQTHPTVNDGWPYRAYVPSPMRSIQPALTPAVQASIDRASRLIATIDATVATSPALSALETLTKSEAIASSYIEGHRVSVTELARDANDPRSASTDTRAVLSNIDALHRAITLLSDRSRLISAEDIAQIQSDIMSSTRTPYSGYRVSQAFLVPPSRVRGERPRITDATHIPPPPDVVGSCMADLIDYINSPPVDAPPLVRAALVHAQFETIHPFADGNGRTGRALIQGMLRRDGVVSHLVLPLSPYFAMNSQHYVDGLNSVRFDGDAPDQHALNLWCETFADCVVSAASNAAEVTTRIEALGQVWAERLHQAGVRSDAAAFAAIEPLMGSVATTVRSLAADMGVSEQTARTALTRMERAGIVSVTRLPSGVLVYQADEVIATIASSQRDIAVPDAPTVPDAPQPTSAPQSAARCGAWMPRARAHCVLPQGHVGWPSGGHRSRA